MSTLLAIPTPDSLISVKESTSSIVDSAKKATTELTIRFADMLVAAAGICSALAFNDAVKSLFSEGGIFHRFAKGGPWIAAIVITLFAISLGFWRAKLIPAAPAPAPKK